MRDVPSANATYHWYNTEMEKFHRSLSAVQPSSLSTVIISLFPPEYLEGMQTISQVHFGATLLKTRVNRLSNILDIAEKLVEVSDPLNDGRSYSRERLDLTSEEKSMLLLQKLYQLRKTDQYISASYIFKINDVTMDNASECIELVTSMVKDHLISNENGGVKVKILPAGKKVVEAQLLTSRKGRKSPADPTFRTAIRSVSNQSIQRDWKKALERRYNEPEAAITSARSLLETVCKYVLDQLGIVYNDTEELPGLYKLCSKNLGLSPMPATDGPFKELLSGCISVVNGLSAIRNKVGDAHGRTNSATPKVHHSELIVNIAGSVASFLLATLREKQGK
jgi:hypothetical protein